MQNRWIISTLFLISSLLGSPSFAASSIKIATDLNRVFQNSAPSPWVSLPKNQLRFIVVDAKTNQGILVGYSELELKQAGVSVQPIDNGFNLLNVTFPRIDFFTGCSKSDCGANQTWNTDDQSKISPVVQLIKSTGVPALIVSSELTGALTEISQYGVTDEQFIVMTALHEIFHLHQELIDNFTPKRMPPDYEACTTGSTADPVVNVDVANWKKVLDAALLGGAGFKASVQNALGYRSEKNDPCLDSLGYIQEAIPQYFSLRLALDARIYTAAQLDHYFSILWLDKVYDASLNYGVGPAMLEALDRIDPSLSWQTNLEKGDTLEDVLREKLSSN